MSIEAGVLFGFDHEPLYWHAPANRSTGALPDSRDLWYVFWENRSKIYGFAHTHPGSGPTGPSMEDVTTFAAIESGLGRRLVWPIVTKDHFTTVIWGGPGPLDYVAYPLGYGFKEPSWVAELRRLSNF